MPPAYQNLLASGELEARAHIAWQSLSECTICPRRCRVDRLAGKRGFCRMGAEPMVSAWNVHCGEEPPVSGTRGSGTIFFTGCVGRCLFCQNYPISQLCAGRVYTTDRLAGIMLELQERGCHNINLVTPTQFVPAILRALVTAARRGLNIPLVYNTSGYDSVETLRWLDGVVDIYLPDAKYADNTIAQELSAFPGYVEANRAALKEMLRQVGSALQLDENGILQRGMIIRHLVLPEGLAQTGAVLNWIAKELSPDMRVSLMSQYFPAHKALTHPQLARKISEEEFEAALEAFEASGLAEGFVQERFADSDHEPVAGWDRDKQSAL